MRFARFLLLMAIGFLLGYAAWHISDLGYFERWERLAIAPQEIPQYFSVSSQENTGGFVKITNPCDYSWPEFSILASPPKGITDCLQRLELDPGGSTRITYVLDSSGTVWQRTHIDNTSVYYLGMLCLPGAGLFVGAIVGLIFEFVRMRKQKTAAVLLDRVES
jgi:hypothetical protein